ncbi:hypothetical protein [Paenibacillus periandrae]|uniref:hypothetical protein n=1 Tax=Paenibacillus periandrae TaxID=1761741 RepID=UPI001F089C0A|nr:hypothetical protein [Paenibacillus periandrae]
MNTRNRESYWAGTEACDQASAAGRKPPPRGARLARFAGHKGKGTRSCWSTDKRGTLLRPDRTDAPSALAA